MSRLAPDYWEGTDFTEGGRYDPEKVYSRDIPAVKDTDRHKQWLSSIYNEEIGRGAVFDDVGASYWVNQLEGDIAGGASEENARARALSGIRGSDEVMFRGDVDELVNRTKNAGFFDRFLGSDRNRFNLTSDSSAEDWRDAFVGRDTSGIYDSDSWYQEGVGSKQDLENLLLKDWYTDTGGDGGDGGDDVVTLPDGDTYDPGEPPPRREGVDYDLDPADDIINPLIDRRGGATNPEGGDYFQGKSNDSVIAEALTSLKDMLAGAFDSIGTIDTTAITDSITRVEGDLSELTKDFAGLDNFDAEATSRAIQAALGESGINSDLADLQTKYDSLSTLNDSLKVAFGDELDLANTTIADLQSKISENQTTANSNLSALQAQFDAAKTSFSDALSTATSEGDTNLSNLQAQFESAQTASTAEIDSLKAELEAAEASGASELEALRSQLSAAEASGSSEIDSLRAQLSAAQTSGASELEALQAQLSAAQESGASEIESLQAQLAASTARGDTQANNLFELLNSTTAAGATQISDLRSQLNAQTQSAAKAAETSASERLALQNQLLESQRTAASNQQAMLASRNQMIGNLNSQWGQRLQQSQSMMNSRLQSAQQQYESSLNNLSQNMNYRILGDNAEGVQLRRSEAFKKGNTSRGTNQLSRSMRINTLNI